MKVLGRKQNPVIIQMISFGQCLSRRVSSVLDVYLDIFQTLTMLKCLRIIMLMLQLFGLTTITIMFGYELKANKISIKFWNHLVAPSVYYV